MGTTTTLVDALDIDIDGIELAVPYGQGEVDRTSEGFARVLDWLASTVREFEMSPLTREEANLMGEFLLRLGYGRAIEAYEG